MSAWWSYRPSDFLLFNARTYHRLVGAYNEALWPAHAVALMVGLALLWLLLRRPAWGTAVLAAGLGAAWGWSGGAFVLQRYAQINWAAPWLAAACLAQALLLLGAAVLAWRRPPAWRSHRAGRTVAALFAAVLLGYPALAPWAGRPWPQAELFGITPDPTALATLVLLALAPVRAGWCLLPIPIAWCALAATTLQLLGAPEWPLPAAAALGGAALLLRRP